MPIAIAKQEQGLLFSEPAIAETGVWCKLTDDIDPAQWASLCRRIGNMDTIEFEQISDVLIPKPKPELTGLLGVLKRLISLKPDKNTSLPLVSIGPGKIGSQYQWEI